MIESGGVGQGFLVEEVGLYLDVGIYGWVLVRRVHGQTGIYTRFSSFFLISAVCECNDLIEDILTAQSERFAIQPLPKLVIEHILLEAILPALNDVHLPWRLCVYLAFPGSFLADIL